MFQKATTTQKKLILNWASSSYKNIVKKAIIGGQPCRPSKTSMGKRGFHILVWQHSCFFFSQCEWIRWVIIRNWTFTITMTERCQIEEEECVAFLEHQEWLINTYCRPLLIPNHPAPLGLAKADFMTVTLISSQSTKLATKALTFSFSAHRFTVLDLHSRSKPTLSLRNTTTPTNMF